MEGVYFYLTLSGLLTIFLWFPYIIARLFAWGLPGLLHSYPENPPELPAWAQRSQRAHLNMVETLPALLLDPGLHPRCETHFGCAWDSINHS